MTPSDVLDAAYDRFLTLEREEWGDGELSAVRRYTWAAWYQPSRTQFARLVVDLLIHPDGYTGGLPLLHRKVSHSLEGLDGIELLQPRSGTVSPASHDPLQADAALGQIVCDSSSRIRVAQKVWRDFPFGARVGILGDNDLLGLVVAGEDFPTVVFDIDERIAAVFQSRRHIAFRMHDVRQPMIGEETFDAVLLDPADGSVALSYWLKRADECLSNEDGARMYLAVNQWRLGRRWSRVVEECARYGLVPCDVVAQAKAYPQEDGRSVTTDLWVFERVSVPSTLPLPYLDIEVFR
ncbi:MAG: bis-aminopropyl spermidine synthase family protein [Actinomyces sp.]|jgi:hypothetical protein|nr:bis-aminopropyl spermidine synthase family protein [Actinomyces sp.]MCI1641538.1 bis-aminopropyl spermidine synthase family protein [Actinomyces sp.]MCI1661718.1 bis-aminopropyl spermidine synthase family protein [Actinomyces sp.]MCI1690466.1 bis-aminopropyl spermidine synthase family protein [Actinomyces sp.]MCI1786444.1 bis-aminopropyl spermidine synthase family protein [Actinomyces sp.]MCI1866150.1 bis-aminopropyl spermidine synthase family protein [Actinomyces sp.]